MQFLVLLAEISHLYFLLVVYFKVYNEVKENPFADTEGDDDTALTGEKNIHFEKLREWIFKVVSMNQTLHCSDDKIGENQVLAQVSPQHTNLLFTDSEAHMNTIFTIVLLYYFQHRHTNALCTWIM